MLESSPEPFPSQASMEKLSSKTSPWCQKGWELLRMLSFLSCVPDPDSGHTWLGCIFRLSTRLSFPPPGCVLCWQHFPIQGHSSSLKGSCVSQGLQTSLIPLLHLQLISGLVHSLDLLSTFAPSYEKRLLGKVSENPNLHLQIIAVFKQMTCTYFNNILISPKCYYGFSFEIALGKWSTYFWVSQSWPGFVHCSRT